MDKGSRPTELTDWIAYARPWNDRQPKKIHDLAMFENRFKQWWSEVQPEGRRKDNLGRFVQEDEPGVDWDEIRLSGKNGLWMVVAGLCFWGQALGSDEARLFCTAWWDCTSDVSWVLNELIRTFSSPSPSTSLTMPRKKRAPSKTKAIPPDENVQADGGISTRAAKRRLEERGARGAKEGSSIVTRSTKRYTDLYLCFYSLTVFSFATQDSSLKVARHFAVST